MLPIQIWIAAALLVVAGFYLAERQKYEMRSLMDVLAFVAMPAWCLEIGDQVVGSRATMLFGSVLAGGLALLLAGRRWHHRVNLLAYGVPSIAAGLLGMGLAARGLTFPDSLREPIAFPARAAVPLLAVIAGWTLNRASQKINLGTIPLIGRQRLGTKVVVLFLIVGLLPLGLMTLLNEQMGRQAVEEQQRSALKTYSTSLAGQLDNRLESYQKDAFQVSEDPRVIRFIGAHARRDTLEGADAMAALNTFLQSDPTYLLAFLLDARGVVQLSSNPDLYNRPDLSFREYYKQAIDGRPYISDISIGVNVPRPPALFAAHPVRDETGTPIGVAALRVDAERGIWSLLSRNRIGAVRTAILVDSDSVVVGIGPDSPLRDRMEYNSLAPLAPPVIESIQANKSFGSHAVVPLGLDALRAGLGGAATDTVDFTFDGHPHVAGFAHLQKKPWAVVVFSDLETFVAPVHAASFRVLAIAAALGLIFVLAALILARTISSPLDALARSALNVARGDLRQKLPVETRDEIGKLTEAFNHMIENLQRAQAELVDRANAQAALAGENARLYEQERAVVEELKRLNDLKDDFVSTVSHELRTPLAGITGLIQTLRRPDLALADADRAECLAEIEAAARRLQLMVADLLQVSAIAAGRLRIQPEPTPAQALWDQLAREFASLPQSCQLRFRTDPSLPTVLGDRLRLEQVLRNLISNAVKYSPGGGTVEVRAEPMGEFARFSVSDQGIGMTPQEVEQLFTKFYRAGNVLTRMTQGTGLGLYISKSIVQAHGGRMWVESQPGIGTTISFTVPLAPAAELRPTA